MTYRPYRGKKSKDLLYDGTVDNTKLYRTVRQLLDTLQFCKEQVEYSNYDNANLDRIVEIVYQWAHNNKIPIGPTQETLRKRHNAKSRAELEKMMTKYAEYAGDAQ